MTANAQMFQVDLSRPKLFVTGVYGSGKTTTAHAISEHTGHPYVSFDSIWSYRDYDKRYVDRHFEGLGDRFVIDAIASNSSTNFYQSFSEFYAANPGGILIVCTLCLSIDEWLGRVARKGSRRSHSERLADYVQFHNDCLPLHQGKEIVHYDTFSNRYVTEDDIGRYMTEIGELTT